MNKQKLWNFLADNGFGFLFIIFISMSLYFFIRAKWCISQVIEAWNYSPFNGILVGFGFIMPFIALGILTYITQRDYDSY